MAGLPGVLVELQKPDGTWADISTYVDLTEGLSVKRGRSDQAAAIEPSEMALTLNNSDGRFTVASAAYGCYLDQPIRCSWVIGGTTYRRFTGFVQKWPVVWDGGPGKRARTVITALDAMPRWSRRTVSERVEAYIARSLSDELTKYWPLSEPAGSTYARPLKGEGLLSPASGSIQPTFGAPTPAAPPSTGMTSNGSQMTARSPAQYPSRIAEGATGFIIGFFISTQITAQTIVIDQGVRTAPRFTLAVDAAGRLVATWSDGANGATFTHPTVIADGVGHAVQVSYYSGTPLYPCSVVVKVDNDSAGRAGYGNTVTTTQVDPYDPRNLTLTGTATYAHLYYTSNVNNLDPAQVYQRGLSGGTAVDKSGNLIFDALANSDTPADNIALGVQTVRVPNDADRTLADTVNLIENAEGGVLFIDANGVATGQNRQYRSKRPLAVTIPTEAATPDDDFGIEYDMDGVQNYWTGQRVTAEGEEAATIVSQNRPSVATHDQRPASGDTTLAVQTDQEVQDHGDWIVNVAAEPRPRFPNLSVDLLTSALAFQKSMAALDISARIRPSGFPSQAPVIGDQIVEGWTETVKSASGSEWSMEFNLTSFAYYQVWVLGDAESGALDGPARLSY